MNPTIDNLADAASPAANASSWACTLSSMDPMFWLVPISSIIALAFALYFYGAMKKEEAGTKLMQKSPPTSATGRSHTSSSSTR